MTKGLVHVPARADGIEARQRLIRAGLRLFASKGFEKTSIRALAQAAKVNVASISYYFGDKAGLYRAVFTEPMGGGALLASDFDRAGLPLREALHRFFAQFLQPLKSGEELRLLTRLHMREMVEPTGTWEHAVEDEIRPQYEALLRLLVRELGLRRADHDTQRLAFAVVGMALHYFVCQDGVQALAPHLCATPRAVDTLAERLAGYAASIVEGEHARRASDTAKGPRA